MTHSFQKYWKFAVLIGSVFLLSACGPSVLNPPPPTPPNDFPPRPEAKKTNINEEFVLSPGEEAKIEGTDLSVYFIDVESDSRCPADVECSSPGTVNVTINIFRNGVAVTKYPFYLNTGRREYVNDDYDFQFVKIAPDRWKKSEEIKKSDYKATFKLIHTALKVAVIEVNEPKGIIFPKEALEYHVGFPEATELWNPTEADSQKAETLLQGCIAEREKSFLEQKSPEPYVKYELDSLQKIKEKFSEYRRQYVGYVHKDSGHKLIWVNLFLPDEYLERNWKKQLIFVNDGGYGFFNVLLDLEDGKCLQFSVNGVA